jgi:hypothetical protein
MSNSNSSGRVFVCVNYPGLVKNDTEAIRTLGGIERISAALSKRNGKLLLNFSPSNIFSKTLCSSSESTIGSELLSLSTTQASSSSQYQQLQNSQSQQSQAEVHAASSQLEHSLMPSLLLCVRSKSDKKITSVEIIGKVQKFLSFESIADFQYLPMMSRNVHHHHHHHHSTSHSGRPSTATNSYTYTAFHHSFDFSSISNYENDLRRSMMPPQLFILPPFFSRFDDAVNYSFRSEPTKKSEHQKLEQSNTIDTSGSKPSIEKNEPKTTTDKSNSSSKQGATTSEILGDEELVTSPKRAIKDKSNEDPSNVLIKSLRQERSSQAVLVTYNCEHIPMCNLIKFFSPFIKKFNKN